MGLFFQGTSIPMGFPTISLWSYFLQGMRQKIRKTRAPHPKKIAGLFFHQGLWKTHWFGFVFNKAGLILNPFISSGGGGRVPYVRPTGKGWWGTPVDDDARHSNETEVQRSGLQIQPSVVGRLWAAPMRIMRQVEKWWRKNPKVAIPQMSPVIRVKFTAFFFWEKNNPSENPQTFGGGYRISAINMQ